MEDDRTELFCDQWFLINGILLITYILQAFVQIP